MAAFDFFFRSQNNIRIEAFPSTEVLQNHLIHDFIVYTIELRITNNSEYSLFIRSLIIKIPKKVDGLFEHIIPAPIGLYPYHLKCSNTYSVKFNLPNNLFDKLNARDKIRFIVTDDLNNRYLSRKYTVLELTPSQ